MSQPTPYTPQTNFAQDEAAQVSGRSTVRTSKVDQEFANIQLSIGQLISNIGLLQRDDGKLRDGVVEVNALNSAVLLLIGSAGFTVSDPLGWLTATNYAARVIVTQGTGTYVSAVAHTSGVFATDLAAGKWALLFDSVTFTASNITFSPTGGISASNVQSALAEVDSEAMKKAANLGDVADVPTARSNLSVFSKAEQQVMSGQMAPAAGTVDAIEASFTPAITALANNLLVFIDAAGANVSSTPTFTPNVGVVAAKTIGKLNGQPLLTGDIQGAGHRLILCYDLSLDMWLLLNPQFSGTVVNKQGANLAFAATINLGSDGDFFDVTSGSGNCTALSTKPAGTRVTLRIQVAGGSFIHDPALLIMQGGANYSPAIGEVITFRSLGSAGWVEESRRELPARIRTAMRLALSQLAR